MTSLSLGVHGLPAAEAGLVRALLTLADPAVTSRWSFAGTGPCDLLLADAAAQDLDATRAARGARTVVLVGAPSGTSAPALARPLRAEQFEACLKGIAARCAPAAAPSASASAAAQAAPPQRHRLRRWPPAELLRAEPLRVRMASQLSRRFLSAADLAQLTGLQLQRVQTFLQLLHGFGLLEPEAAAAHAAPAAARTQPAGARAAGGWTLVQSIRRRLGL